MVQWRPRPTRKCQDHRIGLLPAQSLQSCLPMRFQMKIPSRGQSQTFTNVEASTNSCFCNGLCVGVDLCDKRIGQLYHSDKAFIGKFLHLRQPCSMEDLIDLSSICGNSQLVSAMTLPCLGYHLTNSRLHIGCCLNLHLGMFGGIIASMVESSIAGPLGS